MVDRFALRGLSALSLAAALLASPALAADGERNYDARIEHNRTFRAQPAASQKAAELGLAATAPDLAVTYDETTGATRSLSSHTGYLTAGRQGFRPDQALAVATDYLTENLGALGLSPADLADYQVTDHVHSDVSGATRLYLRQTVAGIPVYNGQLQVNLNREGRVISVNNAFLPEAARAANAAEPALDLATAVAHAADHLGVKLGHGPAAAKEDGVVEAPALSRSPIRGQLMWLPIRQGQLRLVWNFQVELPGGDHWYDINVDAASGKVWTRFDWTAADSYRVYPQPVEAPTFTSPAPPADGRTLVTNPANSTASPFGWHDTNGAAGAEFTTTQGNNVHAYTDTDANNSPDTGSSPSGGSGLAFDFTLDLNQAPSTYRPAAVTNLFYWNNIIHDIQYQYGFDEAAGNFQTNNYGKGGTGNDSVQAEAQDGSGSNNANFSTPPDGSRPRMQMYVWTAPTPDKDGDVDNGIVIHEYGHGISNRLVGGPSNTSCLTNTQQPGEGLSDWWALVYTARPGDTGATARGIGTYALDQPTTGAGIRTQRYSTDPAVNTWTYASINGMAVPHGVGSVWAQAAWEMYWALVNQWGWNANLYDASGNAGNQRAMLYVNEGLKNTACNPTFTQVRDGIIQAATDNHGGEDVCRIWTAFAAFGLGSNAVSGGANSTTPTNGFSVPASCSSTTPDFSLSASPASVSVAPGGSGSSTITVASVGGFNSPVALSASGLPAGVSASFSPGSVTPPSNGNGTSTLSITNTSGASGTYTVTVTGVNGSTSRSTTISLSITSADQASYDAVLKAPKCSTINSVCDSGTSLLLGRSTKGPEPNQPNTINNSCADGTSGTFHSDESNDRIKVVSVDGTPFAAGKQVRIEATVWAYSSPSSDKLDLYYAASANSPSWTFITTLTPSAGGAQTLTATYTLPTGSLQAVRANFRYNGSASSCSTGSYDDHDDLIFAVGAGSADTTAPTTSITSPAAGATVSGTTTISANASDNVAVSRVDFLVDGVVVGNDTTSPYSYAWATGSVSNGSHSLTTKAYDAAGNVGTSAAVSVTVNNSGPVTVFSDNAESASTTFVKANSTTTTQWTRVTASPYAGSYSWKAGSSTGGNYGNSGNATLTTPTLNLSGATTATLSYAFKYSTEANYDFFKVRISTNGGSTWTNLVNVSGTSSGYSAWAPLGNINLNSYVGQTNVKVQFQFTTDGSVTGVGPSIDNVTITKQ